MQWITNCCENVLVTVLQVNRTLFDDVKNIPLRFYRLDFTYFQELIPRLQGSDPITFQIQLFNVFTAGNGLFQL